MGRWVGGWIEEHEAVKVSYCGLYMGGWVGSHICLCFSPLFSPLFLAIHPPTHPPTPTQAVEHVQEGVVQLEETEKIQKQGYVSSHPPTHLPIPNPSHPTHSFIPLFHPPTHPPSHLYRGPMKCIFALIFLIFVLLVVQILKHAR